MFMEVIQVFLYNQIMLFIFDMGGVVTSTFQMDSIYNKINITKEDFLKICSINNDNIWEKLETGKIETRKFWEDFNFRLQVLQRQKEDNMLTFGHILETTMDLSNIRLVKNDLFRLYFHPVLNEKTVELIKALRKNNRVVCGTNTIQSHWENHMERGDYSFFDQTYASNKIGVAKPNPEFFTTILEAEDYLPSHAFFVDDKEENCKAAASVGINTELMKSPQALYHAWIKYAD